MRLRAGLSGGEGGGGIPLVCLRACERQGIRVSMGLDKQTGDYGVEVGGIEAAAVTTFCGLLTQLQTRNSLTKVLHDCPIPIFIVIPMAN